MCSGNSPNKHPGSDIAPSQPLQWARDHNKSRRASLFATKSRASRETFTGSQDEIWFRAISRNFAVNGYALVGNDGQLLSIDNPSPINERISTALRAYFHRSNMPFRHVRAPERARSSGRRNFSITKLTISRACVYCDACCIEQRGLLENLPARH